MPPLQKSQAQSSLEIQDAYIDPSQQPQADVTPGSVHRDILDAIAERISYVYTQMEQTRELASFSNAPNFSVNSLSSLALNYDVIASGSVAATGVITFYKAAKPTQIIDFPAGTIVQTLPDVNNTVIQFVTLAPAQLNPSTQINPSTYRYEATAPIQAIVAGSFGNIGPGTIVSFANPVRNVDGVINYTSTSQGQDPETPSQLQTAVLTKTKGTDLGTATGYENALNLQISNLISVSVVGPNDPAMLRNEFGNEVDIYIIGQNPANFSTTLFATGQSFQVIQSQPVLSVNSIVGLTNNITYVPGVDYNFQKDLGPVYGDSVKAFDKIQWISNNRPGATQQFVINGTYESNVVQLQSYINSNNVRFVTADILVKDAFLEQIVISAKISAIAGYDSNSLASQVQTAVINGISQYVLGQSVDQSNIVNLIAEQPGVLSVGVPLTELRLTTDTPGTVRDIQILKSQYARASFVTIQVS